MRQGIWWGRTVLLMTCGALSACSVFGTHPLRASATLMPTQGQTAHGSVVLVARNEGVQVTYDIIGLRPNTQHTFAIHVGGDCGGPGASHAGEQLPLPTLPAAPDAQPYSAQHTAQLRRVSADGNGVAVGFFVLPALSLDGVHSVVGRTLVIHHGVEDDSDEDEGNGAVRPATPSGPALACGVIVR